MSQPSGKPFVAIVDIKNLRRASITSLLEPWANSENLRLTSFTPDQAREALQAEPNFRMLILSIGGDSIADRENLRQLRELHEFATTAPLVIMSDRENAQDVAAAISADAKGFIHSGITSALAYQALSFILNGGSYFPTVSVQSLETGGKQADNSHNGHRSESESKNQKHGTNGVGSADSQHDSGYQSANITSRQREVLEHVRRGESNKLIARHLGMTEGTVKVHIRQMMRKFQVSNRTQLAVDRVALATESSASFDTRSQNGDGSATRRQQTLPFVSPATRYRSRVDGKH